MAENKRGRKSIYETIILPNLDQIGEWVKNGASEKQICEALGISVSAYNVHKEKKELKETIKKNRTSLALELRSSLVSLAMKHTLETKKTYMTTDDEGRTKKHTEITMKEVDPLPSAISLLLNNIDRENWKPNWDDYEFKKAELELRKKLADDKNWDIEE